MPYSRTNRNLDFSRPLGITHHRNDSIISLESCDSTSEREEVPSSSAGEETSTGSSIFASTTQESSDYEVIRRTSHHQVSRSGRNRPLTVLELPKVFSAPATSGSHAPTRPRDGPPVQAVQPQSQRPAPVSQLGPSLSSVDRQERHVGQVVHRQNTVNGYSTGTGSVTSTFPHLSSLTGLERSHTSSGPSPSQPSQPSILQHSPPADVPSPPNLPPLLSGKIALPRRIICHSKPVQERMEQLKISWGVQYELARGVLAEKWTWGDITDHILRQLRGSNAQAASRVGAVVSATIGGTSTAPPTESSTKNLNLWEEYDREQDAILEGQSRGLGLKGEWKGIPDWYGGRIEQIVRVSKSKPEGKFTYRLDRPDIKKSTRFARFVGSRRILKVNLSKDLQYEKGNSVREHLSGPFVLCGRVFVPFASKEGSAYMVEVNEDEDRKPDRAQGDDKRTSLWDFIEWHNPLGLNQKQPLSKWTTRFDLGLSTTVPVLEFEPGNIEFIPDILAPQKEGEGTTLTDGCGFINGAALTLIARRIGLSSRPTAVQGRVAGAKGLWILHGEDRSPMEPPRIWIRDSQRKVKLPSLEAGSAHVIFDLVAQSTRITVPGHLNSQTITNLAENGVHPEVFQELMRAGLTEVYTSLTQWDGPGAMPLLWNTINGMGSVTRTRLQRVAHGLSRAIGLANRFEMDREGDGDDSEDEDPSLDGNDSDKSLYGAVLALIQAGFDPKSSPILNEKMRHVIKTAVERHLQGYHIEVRQSAEAFIVPDPFGVLEEGQIHFRSSQELGDPLTQTNLFSVRGPVLVNRNPTMVASDIQKVEAVEHELLADYVNVIVFSTKGSRSLASFLAGGDYDGDTVMVNWAPSVVEQFNQPNVVDKPDGLESKNFEAHIELVSSFYIHHQSSTPVNVQKSFVTAFLRSLDDDHVGQYSNYHRYATYTKGYSHPETIRLAYMFTTCLDSRKTGHRVQQEVFKKKDMQYSWGLPECFRSAEERDQRSQSTRIKRGEGLRPFILDILRGFGHELKERFLREYENLSGQPGAPRFEADRDLLSPYQKVMGKLFEIESLPGVYLKELVREARKELRTIEGHVENTKTEWARVFRTGSTSARNRMLANLRQKFESGPDVPHLSHLGDISEIRASCAYRRYGADNPKFAFGMAFDVLCKIKARESGGTTLSRELGELVTVPKIAVRTLSALRSGV